ncbi:MAG: EFR1 family ferrodoxin [Defluviitaleaceae bacterium]|nr:EFR1 family ferrodoxin [Defluviitaleaceae bacterium]
MLTLYFSGTGNTAYIAELFSQKMNAACLSIENDSDFSQELQKHDTVAICYPIYGSRVPLIMRQFVAANLPSLQDKRLIILVTQLTFSGDGARVLCDLFPQKPAVIYAEHFFMPNNVCNFALLGQTKNVAARLAKAEKKLEKICQNIKNGVVKKRGFSAFSKLLGSVQGKPWQGDSKNAAAATGTMEHKAKHDVQIDDDCNVCGICANICPMKNLENVQGKISHKNNCTMCYRCINRCPKRAITVFFHKKPKWQYKLPTKN